MAYQGSQAVTGKGTTLYIGPATPITATTASSTALTAISPAVAGITLVVGSLISGTGIPLGDTITATPTSSTATLATAATASGSGVQLNYQTLLGEVRSITQSGSENAEDDVTNLLSTSKEIITTIGDEGTLDFTCNRVPGDGGQILLQNGFQNQTRFNFTIQLPLSPTQSTVGDKYTGVCYVKSRGFAFEPVKANQFTAKLRITGSVTFTAGS